MRILSLALCLAGCLATKSKTTVQVHKVEVTPDKSVTFYNLGAESLKPVWEDTVDKSALTPAVADALGQLQADYGKLSEMDTKAWQDIMKNSLAGLRSAIDAVAETDPTHGAVQDLLKSLDGANGEAVIKGQVKQKLVLEMEITVERKRQWKFIIPFMCLFITTAGLACYFIYTHYIAEPKRENRGGYRATHDYSDDESSYDGQYRDLEAPDEYEHKYEQYKDYSDSDSHDASAEDESWSSEGDDSSDSQEDLYQDDSQSHCDVDLPAEEFPSYRASDEPTDTMA